MTNTLSASRASVTRIFIKCDDGSSGAQPLCDGVCVWAAIVQRMMNVTIFKRIDTVLRCHGGRRFVPLFKWNMNDKIKCIHKTYWIAYFDREKKTNFVSFAHFRTTRKHCCSKNRHWKRKNTSTIHRVSDFQFHHWIFIHSQLGWAWRVIFK